MRYAAWLLIAAAASASAPALAVAQRAQDLVVTVEEGGRRQPIARLQGQQWTAVCTAPPGALPAVMRAVRPIAARAAEWTTIEPVVRGVFDQREREQRVGVARTSRVPAALEYLYASGPAADAVYYFEASKRIEGSAADADPDTDPAGLLRIRVTGWLRGAGGRITPIATKADLQWEQLDRVNATSQADLIPLGMIDVGDALVWVMKRETLAAPTFMLYELRASAARMVLRMGGC